MAADAYIVELIAGLLYFPVAIRLLWLAYRTGEIPERLLGLAFLSGAMAYVLYELSSIFGLASLDTALVFTARLTYAVGCVILAVFTQRLFRPSAGWATGVSCAIALLLAGGIFLSVLQGDWEGTSLSGSGFWLEWIGQIAPCVWLSAEAFPHFIRSRRRLKLGLSDPVVCNRYLLWGLYGVIQLGVAVSILPMYLGYAEASRVTPAMDALLGGFELLSLSMIWLAFFPPAAYRSWISGAKTTAEQSTRG